VPRISRCASGLTRSRPSRTLIAHPDRRYRDSEAVHRRNEYIGNNSQHDLLQTQIEIK
jgi:hypothetical protein